MLRVTKELISKFKSYLMEEEKSKATFEKYVRDILTFCRWIGERQAEIEKRDVLMYKEYLIETYAPTSVNSMLSSINSFFEFAGFPELKVKVQKIQKQVFLNKEKELTRKEYLALVDTAFRNGDKRLGLLMQTICSAGIRVSELKSITVDSVNSGRAVIKCKGKMRVILLPGDLRRSLKKYAKEQKITRGSIFVSRNGKPLDRSNIWKMMKALCNKAGVIKEKVFPHNLRHLFARTYYSLQKDIVRLADILGHSNINTTRIYTMETGEVHLKQIERLGLLKC